MENLTFLSEGQIHNRMAELRMAFRTAHGSEASVIRIRFVALADELAERQAVYAERGTDPYGQRV
jgi:hypothetical protein